MAIIKQSDVLTVCVVVHHMPTGVLLSFEGVYRCAWGEPLITVAYSISFS